MNILNDIAFSSDLTTALTALVGTVTTVLAYKVTEIKKKLDDTHKKAAEASEQVKNTHPTNLREDIDHVTELVRKNTALTNSILEELIKVQQAAAATHLDINKRLTKLEK